MKRLVVATALILAFFPLGAQTAANLGSVRRVPDYEVFEKMDAYIDQVREDWNIQGMAVLIGDGEEMLYCRYHGWRDEEASERHPVDGNTLFQLASVSKSFTATLVAMLVDEGLISWDDKVADILPDFEMPDKWTSEHATVRDFTCHRSGLDRESGSKLARLGYDKEDLMHVMRFMKPAYEFRDGYRYNDLAYVIPALIVEKVTGKSWKDNIIERIYEPLGMDHAMFRGEEYAGAFADGTASWPHDFRDDNGRMAVRRHTPEEISAGVPAASEAAGGIITTPMEMMRWAQFHLNGGVTADGRRILSQEQMDILHAGVNVVSQSLDHITLYAQGWNVEQSRKCHIIWHTGTNTGQIALCAFIPELDRVVTINADTKIGAEPRFAILRRYIDLCLGLEDYDYNAEALKAWHEAHPVREAVRTAAAADAPETGDILGNYIKNDIFGEIRIGQREGRLLLTMVKPGRTFELRHSDGNFFEFMSSGTTFRVEFLFEGPKSKASGIRFVSGVPEEFGPWMRDLARDPHAQPAK